MQEPPKKQRLVEAWLWLVGSITITLVVFLAKDVTSATKVKAFIYGSVIAVCTGSYIFLQETDGESSSKPPSTESSCNPVTSTPVSSNSNRISTNYWSGYDNSSYDDQYEDSSSSSEDYSRQIEQIEFYDAEREAMEETWGYDPD